MVTDENRAPISEATVMATWTSSNGLLPVSQEATTGRDGVAKFSLSGPGGIYTLTVDDIAKGEYLFDADNSTLSGSLAAF